MKRGDKVPVTIAGQTVANAEVRELGDGTVTLVVPATLVVMATRTEISHPEPVQQETETIITGVDRTSNEPVESAVVGGPETISDNSTDTTGGDNAQSQAPTDTATGGADSTNTSEVVSPENVQEATQDISNSTVVVETSPELTNE